MGAMNGDGNELLTVMAAVQRTTGAQTPPPFGTVTVWWPRSTVTPGAT